MVFREEVIKCRETKISQSLKSLSGTFVILVNFLGHGAKPFGKHTNLYSLSRNSNFKYRLKFSKILTI